MWEGCGVLDFWGGSRRYSGRREGGNIMTVTLSLRELAALGTEEVLAKATRGELQLKHLWVAAKGAEKYVAAVREGDIADPLIADLRAEGFCARCPSMTITETDLIADGGHVFKCWCGPALEEHAGPRPTCGCLVGLKVNGKVIAAGKTVVGKEKCGQRQW